MGEGAVPGLGVRRQSRRFGTSKQLSFGMKPPDTEKRRTASSYTEDEIRDMTPGERVELCMLLSLEAYGYTPERAPRMRRDIERVIRPGDARGPDDW